MTRDGGQYAVESHDRRHLYYAQSDGQGIRRSDLSGGNPTEIVKERVYWGGWALGERGLYYATTESRLRNRRQALTVKYLDFDTGDTRTLFEKEGPQFLGLTVSPDERSLLFHEGRLEHADLMLLENFR